MLVRLGVLGVLLELVEVECCFGVVLFLCFSPWCVMTEVGLYVGVWCFLLWGVFVCGRGFGCGCVCWLVFWWWVLL